MNSWAYESEWFEETNVSTKIVEFLKRNGYVVVRFNTDKRDRGPDIVYEKNGQQTLVEVKGYPSDRYVRDNPRRNIKKGDLKPTSPRLQARHWFAEALLSLRLAGLQGNTIH